MYSIGLEKDFIFVHIPKSGGGAIKNHLLKHVPKDKLFYPPEGYHSRLIDYENVINNNPNCKPFSEYFIFTVVRNPFERVVSLYEWKRKGTSDSYFKEISSKAEIPLGRNHVQRPSEINRIPVDMDFSNFIFGLDELTEPKELAEYLYWQECNAQNSGRMYLVNYDNIQSDWNRICENHLGLPVDNLLKIHKSDSRPLEEYYTHSFLVGVIYGIFMREIRQFNWRPPWDAPTT